MNQFSWIFSYFCLWFGISVWLIYKGLVLIAEGVLNSLEKGSDKAMLFVGIGLFIGFIKGRWVLTKTARKAVLRIFSLQNRPRFKEVYPPSYFLLIFSMMGLGLILKNLPICFEIRGLINVAVGSALQIGSFTFFRALFTQKESF